MSSEEVTRRLRLPPLASSAAEARRLVRETLETGQVPHWSESAELVVSEMVTNALVHAATEIELLVRAGAGGVRVEVRDGSDHLPARREYSSVSGTGRGLHLVTDLTDEWGAELEGDGKVVWFELHGAGLPRPDDDRQGPGPVAPAAGARSVELLNFPLLMHSAWQEHASALLREFLLVNLDEDDFAPFAQHAEASDALNLLSEQVPVLELGPDPEAIMSAAVEPQVSAPRVALQVPSASVPSFATLSDLLDQAAALAESGALLVPPPQPEVTELRMWICSQVRGQVVDDADSVPWSLSAGTVSPQVTADSRRVLEEITGSAEARLAMDERSVILAVSRPAAALLGYARTSDLVGQRITRIVPARYHQAHIAGTTLHMVNGRSPLLGQRLTVPVVTASGSEVEVVLLVEPQHLEGRHRLFVADFSVVPRADELVPA